VTFLFFSSAVVPAQTLACWPVRVPFAEPAHACEWQGCGRLRSCIALLAHLRYTVCGFRCSIDAVPSTLATVVQGLTGRADIAIVFRFVSETLGAEEWTPLSVDTVAGPHIGGDVTIRRCSSRSEVRLSQKIRLITDPTITIASKNTCLIQMSHVGSTRSLRSSGCLW
jgi:hypothetical protein